MGFSSFLGRLLFASLFILSAWQMYNEFGVDGGPTAKAFVPMVTGFQNFLNSKLSGAPIVDVKHVVTASLFLKGLGGLLFIFGNPIGAVLLMCNLGLTATPVLYDYFSHNITQPELVNETIQIVALLGALLYFIGMKNSLSRRQTKRKIVRPKTA